MQQDFSFIFGARAADSMWVTSIIFSLIALGVGLILNFLPILIAMMKGSFNLRQVVMLNLVCFVAGIGNGILFGVLIRVPIIAGLISIVIFIVWIITLVKAIRGY